MSAAATTATKNKDNVEVLDDDDEFEEFEHEWDAAATAGNARPSEWAEDWVKKF